MVIDGGNAGEHEPLPTFAGCSCSQTWSMRWRAMRIHQPHARRENVASRLAHASEPLPSPWLQCLFC
eukprot:3166709-Rhodomonas_salina.1